ncbi:hypothetical protein Tco_1459307 [Tanacetum coccineum]
MNDYENLGKLQPKADIGIFIGYAPTKKAFWIYNRRTRRIIETIHVDFDELIAMAFEHSSSRAMIQAIDKRLKTRRIMQSLERFIGGRSYGVDLRLLQRTI